MILRSDQGWVHSFLKMYLPSPSVTLGAHRMIARFQPQSTMTEVYQYQELGDIKPLLIRLTSSFVSSPDARFRSTMA